VTEPSWRAFSVAVRPPIDAARSLNEIIGSMTGSAGRPVVCHPVADQARVSGMKAS